ncbi:hypothetical protein FKM82_022219 [Ascaphus truei]
MFWHVKTRPRALTVLALCLFNCFQLFSTLQSHSYVRSLLEVHKQATVTLWAEHYGRRAVYKLSLITTVLLALSQHECGMNAVKCVAFEKKYSSKPEMLEKKRGRDSSRGIRGMKF